MELPSVGGLSIATNNKGEYSILGPREAPNSIRTSARGGDLPYWRGQPTQRCTIFHPEVPTLVARKDFHKSDFNNNNLGAKPQT